MVTKVISCGDSFPCGMGLGNDRFKVSYPVRIAEHLNATLTSLARPGCCNFSISLMVKWLADNVDKDTFYIISTTNEDRLHWLRPGIVYNNKHNISIDELNYEDYDQFLLTKLPFSPNNTIQSETCSNILLYQEDKLGVSRSLSREPKSRITALDQYIKLIHDSKVKRHIDTSLLATQLHRLKEKTNNWLLLTEWTELESMFKDNSIKADFGALSKDYPDSMGSGHFSHTGHRTVFNNIMKWYDAR
jgi:hypothetical protein